MTWVRLDEGFYQHPKVIQAGPLGMAMQVAALCYCNRNLTDGFIPRGAVPLLLNLDGIGTDMDENDGPSYGIQATWYAVVGELIRVGIWTEEVGGYHVHNFTDYQPTKQQVITERAQKQAAGQAGGIAAAKARAKAGGVAESNPVPVPVPVPVTDSKPEPSTTTSSRPNAIKMYEEIFGRPVANITIRNGLLAFEETRPEGCLRHCLMAAADAEATDWRYAKTILQRHEEENCDGSDTHPANNGRRTTNGRQPDAAEFDPDDPDGIAAGYRERLARG